MTSNFDFLKTNWEELYNAAVQAEQHALTAPRTSCMYSRRALELAVKEAYKLDTTLNTPYQETLSAMMHEYEFKNSIGMDLFYRINLIRKLGNIAIHSDSKIGNGESLKVLKNLFDFLSWLGITYTVGDLAQPRFDEVHIPTGSEKDKKSVELQQLVDSLQAEDKQNEQQQLKILAENEDLKQKLELYKQQIQEEKPSKETYVQEYKVDPSEQETRQMYIDLMLREAGWDPQAPNVEEYEVANMPNTQNQGWADYVLWGDDGLPLAVVEAKRTTISPKQGKHQAKLYADALEEEKGQRPIIFYSNGFETWIWDDTQYPPRQVFGFYSKDQLLLLINRRNSLQNISTPNINHDIAGGSGRTYQIEAITRVCENLQQGYRKSLLVMATGAGKTRVSAAIVDILTKANWAKRILFLADRNALVTQAKSAYAEYLPNLSGVNLTKDKETEDSRLVFSTYPTMMNAINDANENRSKRFGVGYFDLIIIDEAHRSVYQKYQEIFNYFDAMILGLTATPKDEVDKNTYELFDLESGVPTFAYDLDQAVEDKFLVPYKVLEVQTRFQEDGVKYSDLSEEEKDEYEATFRDEETGDLPEEINSSALNTWLFNQDTVDKVLDTLMEHGLKVAGGDKLGKTIIFAANQKHADYIEDRFNKKYPQFRGDFLEVITHHKRYAHDILDRFKSKNGINPYIAVSVDMLDTGVDVPAILNLVFFKKVRSKAKFWQMIGRGTRLCPDLFAPGDDKKHFLVLDFCGNFGFFDENPDGFKTKAEDSVIQKIFKTKVRMIKKLQDSHIDDAHEEYRQELIEEIYSDIASLDQKNFIVRRQLQYLHKYLNKDTWQNLGNLDVNDINSHLSGLIIKEIEDELAIRFDLLIATLQESILEATNSKSQYVDKIISIAGNLERKFNIPAVAAQEKVIKQIQQEDYWKEIDIISVNRVGQALRDLIKFLDRENARVDAYTNFEDKFGETRLRDGLTSDGYGSTANYKEKIERFIRDSPNSEAVQKIKNNIQITKDDIDELARIVLNGDTEDFEGSFENADDLALFIRQLVGLDQVAIQHLFAKFLDDNSFSADQINFVNMIIKNISVNGVLEPEDLYETPFTMIHNFGLDGVFKKEEQDELLAIVHGINEKQRLVDINSLSEQQNHAPKN